MFYLCQILTAIIPAIGMLSGLCSSVTISLLLILLILHYRKNLKFSVPAINSEIIFTVWCFCCCLWSLSVNVSIITFLQVFGLIFLGLMVNDAISSAATDRQLLAKSLIIGMSLAVIFFFIEYHWQGLIYKTYKVFVHNESIDRYFLHTLDRGCALLSISTWILIGLLMQLRRYLTALSLYVLVFYTLYLSDSLASLVGFASGGCLLLLGRLISAKFFKLTSFVLLLGSLIMPIAAYNIDPWQIANHYKYLLPDSAKQRLFIWHYVGEKIAQKPLVGWGFSSSKKYKSQADEMIYYANYYWSPFPLHPHNNILQILFETGIIGLFLFLALVNKYLKKITDLIDLDLNFASVSYACFINYYVIGMISFSVWQTWWIASGVWTALMMRYFVAKGSQALSIS